jgi:nicotinate-nucleotide pyrophosphorylase (carboxylating)
MKGAIYMNWIVVDEIIKQGLVEDSFNGDITTVSLIDLQSISEGRIIAKESGIVAGIEVAERVFKTLNDTIYFKPFKKDGDKIDIGQTIAEVKGLTQTILTGERLALNLLQHMSGIATLTRKFVEEVKGYDVRISDTRKTIPGLRVLEKYAVRMGGGHNHRFNLSTAVLIKDNHIKAVGGIKKAVELARKKIPHTMTIEVEVENLEQLDEALKSGADIIMLDNMDIPTMTKAVEIVNSRAILEASGDVNLDTVRKVAATGVDVISVGALTHSAKALNISLKL